MALNTAAIQRAIRNILLGTIGHTRTVAVSTFAAGQAADSAATKALALIRPRMRIHVSGSADSEASPFSVSSSRAIKVIGVRIVFSYSLPANVEIDERDAVIAEMGDALELARQALTLPGNLTSDGESVPSVTGIVSGMMVGDGGEARPVVSEIKEDWETLIAEATLSGSVVVVIEQNVGVAAPISSGAYEFWHADSVTTDTRAGVDYVTAAAGLVSGVTLVQSTESAQPVLSAGLIVHDGTADTLATTDAGLCAIPDSVGDFTLMVGGSVTTKASTQVIAGWGCADDGRFTDMAIAAAETKMRGRREWDSGNLVQAESSSGVLPADAVWEVSDDATAGTSAIAVYKDGSLIASAAGAVTARSHIRFGVGGKMQATTTNFANLSWKWAAVWNRKITATERAAVIAWHNAGASL